MSILLILVVMATVQWTVVPDGPTTYAVVRDYGGRPYWSLRPDERGQEMSETRICSQVPSEEAARQIADFLNSKR